MEDSLHCRIIALRVGCLNCALKGDCISWKSNQDARKAYEERLRDWARKARFDMETFIKYTGKSLRQLEREMQKNLGHSPREWLTEQRIFASEYLLLSDHSIKDTAIELGFSQSCNFTREFKKVLRVTPTKFVSLQKIRNVAH